MVITILDNIIKVGDIFSFKADGSDLNENKILELLFKLEQKENIIIDNKLKGDDIKKCCLIKEIIDTFSDEYFSE